MPSVGKTSFLSLLTHPQLSSYLHVVHFQVVTKDLDEMIGQAIGEDYHTFYRRMGWLEYAQKEVEAVQSITRVADHIKADNVPMTLLLAAGGGLVYNEIAMKMLKEAGAKFIWFKTRKPFDAKGKNSYVDAKHWKILYKERKKLYKKWADYSCNSAKVLKQGRNGMDKLQLKFLKSQGEYL